MCDVKTYPNKPQQVKQNICKLKEEFLGLHIDKMYFIECVGHLLPILSKDNKIGFVSAKMAEVVIKPQYDEYEGCFKDKDSFVAVSVNKKWGALDSSGNFVLPLEYKRIIPPIGDTVFAVEKYGERFGKNIWGAIDARKNEILPFSEDIISLDGFDGGLCRIHLKKGWGVVNSKGDIVIEPGKHPNIFPIYNQGFSYVRTLDDNGKYVDYVKSDLVK